MSKDKIRVIMLRPGKRATVEVIDASLSGMQEIVGGYIQAVYPFDDPVAIVCNEEGKLDGLEMNRALRDEDGDIYDVLCGTAFLCGLTAENFGDMPEELTEKYLRLFGQAETFFRDPTGNIHVLRDDR